MLNAKVPPKCGDVDARVIVPVEDEIGGVVIYAAGRPAYYVLQGEWFEALPEPRSAVRAAAEGPPWRTSTLVSLFAYPSGHGPGDRASRNRS